MYMCQSKSPNSSHPHPIPAWRPYICPLHIVIISALPNKIICAVFLDSTFMHQYMIFVFLLLTYIIDTLSRSHPSANDPMILSISYKTELDQKNTKRFTPMWMSGGALENLPGCYWWNYPENCKVSSISTASYNYHVNWTTPQFSQIRFGKELILLKTMAPLPLFPWEVHPWQLW